MSSITDASDANGDAETSPDAGPKTHHNLTTVYIDHNLDKPNAESTDDEAGNKTSGPTLTLVYIDHHLDGSVTSDSSQGSDGSNPLAAHGVVTQNQQGLFRLPPELRLVIWELILPGKRLLRARARYGRDWTSQPDNSSLKIKGRQGRWHFKVYEWDLSDPDDAWMLLEIPEILQICKESRNVALRHGSFIFGQRDKSHDTGTWWNSELDVLGFDDSWDLHQHPWALQNLQGLEHVKNVAMDEKQAWTVCYDAGYNGEDPLAIPRKLREPLAVAFQFRESDDTGHYILEFFPHFQQLSIYFSTIFRGKFREWLLDARIFNEERALEEYIPQKDAFSVTFRLGSNIQTAVKQLRRYRKLCMITKVKEPYDHDLDKLTDGPVYSIKDDDVGIDHLDHWMGAGFGMCQADQNVPI